MANVVAYRLRKDEQDTWGNPIPDTGDDLYHSILARVPGQSGPYVLSQRKRESEQTVAKRTEAADRAVRWIRKSDLGIWVHIEWAPNHILRIQKLELGPADLDGVPIKVRKIVGVLNKTFPSHHNLGICNCRKIDGMNVWSQHAFCWAYDAGGNLQLVCEMGDTLVALGSDPDSGLEVGKVIYNRRVWTPETGYRPYNGTDPHTGHLHVEPPNAKTGTPPCARS